MKTHEHIISWLLRAAMMLVTLACVQTAVAQQDEIEGGEAFYIYQNDGHFNGFFYDEVKQMRYSRLDTLNREHDHYVSQEIVTEDSIYRIMLTAIDSVSFYQPEIRYAKEVRFMSDEGMMDYFIRYTADGEDKHVLDFALSMPKTLRPKVGDVLSCLKVEGYDGAFVYKVAEVKEQSDRLLAVCKPVEDLNEVLEQFITIEQVRNVQTPEGGKTRRRIAGLKIPKREEGNVEEFTLFNIGTTLEGNLVLFEKLKLGLSLGIGFGMTAKAEYKFVSEEWYTKIEIKNQVATNFGIQLDGELIATSDLAALPGVGALVDRFTKIPLPTNLPLFNINVAPMPFTKVEAHLKVGLSTGLKVSANRFKLEFQWKRGEWPYLDYLGEPALPFLPIPSSIDKSADWSITAQLNGTLQTGIKFPIETGTENWLNKVLTLRAGATIYAGPKISGAIDFSLLEKGNDGFFSAKEPMGFYERMKGTKIDVSLLSIDAELSANAKIIGKALGTEQKSTTSTAFGSFSLNSFPTISGFECDVTGDQMNIVTGKCDVRGEVFLPEHVGFGLYKKKDEESINYDQLYRYVTRNETYFINTFNSVDLKIENVEPGTYKAHPIVNTLFGVIPITSEEQIINVAPQEVELDPKSITAEEEGGKFEVELHTSFNQSLTASPDAEWIEAEIKHNVGPSKSTIMYVTVKENDTDKFRKSGITVTQVLKDGSLCERKLEVKQYGGLQLSVNKLNIEAEDSTILIDILTSYKPITINLNGNDDWLSYKLDDRKLKLTAKKNEGIERKATITVAAWSKKHNGISTVELKVTQKGLVDVSLDKDALTFAANGGSEQVNLTLGGNYTFTNVRVSKVDDSWLIVEKHDNYFIATAIPNTEEEEINSVIELVFTKVKQGVPGPATCVVPFYITQEAALPEPKGFTIHSLSLGTAIGLTCTNLNQYKERPYEGWEPAKKANMAFYYDNGDEDRSAVITIIDENTLLLECKKEIEETDPEYPGWLAQTVETFTATFTKSKEEKEDEFEEDIIHIRVSNVHHVRDYTELYEDTKYTNHSEYTIDPNKKLSVLAYPSIYDYDGKLQYRGSLLYNGFRKSWGNVFSNMSFYEEFSWDNGKKVQKYVYTDAPDETDGISLQIHFDTHSQWDDWLENKQVDDAFEARKK